MSEGKKHRPSNAGKKLRDPVSGIVSDSIPDNCFQECRKLPCKYIGACADSQKFLNKRAASNNGIKR